MSVPALDLFTASSPSRSKAVSKRAAEIATLIPLALELARKAAPAPVSVANLRVAAAQRGLLPNVGKGRELSFLGVVMKQAGLTPRGFVRSTIPESHGNLARAWYLS